jgi:hypothetical protein
VISLLGVFIGAYLTGYVSNLRSKAEGILNGFMVGVMTIFTPILLAMQDIHPPTWVGVDEEVLNWLT